MTDAAEKLPEPQRIVIGTRHSLCLSRRALGWMAERGSEWAAEGVDLLTRMAEEYPGPYNDTLHHVEDERRADPLLVAAVTELGGDAVCGADSGDTAHIVEIPAGVEWTIQEGDGPGEWIAEKHRVWP